MDKHTFVICAYKESQYLEQCIKSLRRQTIKSTIIMVTSTPNHLITTLSQRYGIPLYINPSGGIVQDWNFAYEKADAEYVTIAHQDDIYFPQYAEQVLRHMDKNKNSIIGFTDYVEIRNGKKVISNQLLRIKRLLLLPLQFRFLQNSKWVRRRVLSLGCPICCPSVLFNKGKVSAAPFKVGFRSDEDWEAWEKLSKMDGRFIYVPVKLIGHRIHEESETTNILGDNARKGEDYIMFRKFWPDIIAKKLTGFYSLSEKSNEILKGRIE